MAQSVARSKKTPVGYCHTHRSSLTSTQWAVTIAYLLTTAVVGAAVLFMPTGRLTLGGVPVPIILTFLQDGKALNAYLDGDSKRLHARLGDMGIEEAMKDFYRTQIPNEAELDQHIHQLLYERTGYVGTAYRVNAEGVLVLKDEG
jgi:hypothetical protein